MVAGETLPAANVEAFVSVTLVVPAVVVVGVAVTGWLNGGLVFSPVTIPVTGSSVKMAYPARMIVFCFLKGSQTKPILGSKFLLLVWKGCPIPLVPTCTRNCVAGSKTVNR